MEERLLDRQNLLVSFALHALLFAMMLFYASQNAKNLTITDDDWVEVTMLPPSVQKNRRIVDSDAGQITKEAAPDAYLGKKTRTVERETVSQQKEDVPATPRPKPQASPQVAKRALPKAIPLSKLGIPIVPKRQKQVADSPDYVPFRSGPQPSPTEFIQGIREANETALNTREYIFFGYFKRVRDSLDRAWRPLLRNHIDKMYRHGRNLASNREHKTQTLVTLNQKGSIVKIEVIGKSGTRYLDQAAIDAFNKAGPFPNPPKGLMDQRGQVEIRWDFVLRT